MCDASSACCSRSDRNQVNSSLVGLNLGERSFLQSVLQFIQEETRYQQCPAGGANELRLNVYSAAFNKVISRATVYKDLLLRIKSEYDNVIREMKRREDDVRVTRRNRRVSTSLSQSIQICRRRTEMLRDRISELQEETSRLRDKIQREKFSVEQKMWKPGLTVAQSQDPQILDQYLSGLCAQRQVLLDRRSQCQSLQVQTDLESELKKIQNHRDKLGTENQHLKVLYKRLQFVHDCLCRWEVEQQQQQCPLEEVLVPTLEKINNIRATGDDSVDSEPFEDQEPTGLDGSELLDRHLNRFLELFSSGQHKEAALVAARCPGGVLRNTEVMEMFEGVAAPSGRAPPGSAPPLLLFFQALLTTAPAGLRLSLPLSLQFVLTALPNRAFQLLIHAVTQNKLTFSEHLGDILTEHAQKNPDVSDQCLTLSTLVFEGCGLDKKSALSMCRRGLIHSAAELMEQSQNLSQEDIIWVLCRSPSLSLLRALTEPQDTNARPPRRRRRAAILSVAAACSALLLHPGQQQLVLQLLDHFIQRGLLQDVILEDEESTVDVWNHIASLCAELNRDDLSRTIRSVLLDQSGTRVLTPDPEGARLMEHVFL